jgi:alkylation response protein AidB-like acyl-CoA dehydrogenase
VDFDLSDDQQALAEAATDLLDGRAPITVVRAAMERGGRPDPDLWSAMVDQGWCGLAVPESLGGVGLGWVEAAVVLEQVGAHVAPAPILGQLVALDALATTEFGPALVAGDLVATVAVRLDEPVVYAPDADIVVVAESDRLVTIDLRGHQPAAEPAMDLTRTLGWLRADALASSPRLDIGGAEAITRHLDVAAVAYAAELLGLAQRALDLSVAYARERVQFGRPIGSFQAVKHRCADMLVDVEGMRSAVYWAAWCVAVGDGDASVAASTAKCWCSDAADRVMASALQVHGGIGFTWENDVHLYLKRAHLDGLSFGDATFHRARLAGLLRAKVESGQSVI